jgi:hypothetical protein
MELHKNARTCQASRILLVQRILGGVPAPAPPRPPESRDERSSSEGGDAGGWRGNVLSSRIGRRRSPGKVSRGRPGPEAPERGKDSIQSHVHVLPAVSRRRRDYLKTRTAVALAVSVAALAAPKVLAERGCGCPSSRSAGAAHRSSRRRA